MEYIEKEKIETTRKTIIDRIREFTPAHNPQTFKYIRMVAPLIYILLDIKFALFLTYRKMAALEPFGDTTFIFGVGLIFCGLILPLLRKKIKADMDNAEKAFFITVILGMVMFGLYIYI